MPSFRTGTVEKVVESDPDRQLLDVRVDGAVRRAVLYPRYAAFAQPGDRVVVNTTALDLDLGSGGTDFVVWNLSSDAHGELSEGHLMKLRYTPAQTDVLCVEAPESPHHEALTRHRTVHGMPVVAASLHSQLLPVLAAMRSWNPSARIAYVMTDGGALELAYSNTVRALRDAGWLAATITAGHAVGGDLEAIGLYSALLAAKHVVKADAVVVGMGPGVAGTGTPFGTTALEMGLTINAAGALDGIPVACVRMSSADERGRHTGVSHHTLTALDRVALVPADVPVPDGHAAALDAVAARHRVIEVVAEQVLLELEEAAEAGLHASHMGRTPAQDPLFFLAAGAAGFHAASLL